MREMRVRKISAFFLVSLLVLSSLTLFSFAADTHVVKDSGSPEVSLMALRSIAADDGISLAAAEGNSGQFGYNIESSNVPFRFDAYNYGTGYQLLFFYALPAGTYSFSISFDRSISWAGFHFSDQNYISLPFSDNSFFYTFTLSEFTQFYFGVNFDGASELPEYYDVSLSELTPVEGISSGYTYNSGILDRARRSIFDTLNLSFGNQPAGKYLINIYHWGDSYVVRFQISDSTESYYLPTSTNGSVTTLVYNHPGGDFTLNGSFTADNIETTAADGYYATSGNSTVGDVDWHGPSSWVFNITDIVAIPYEQAADSNFGFFAPIIGFFRDQFIDMKSWIAVQIDKIAGDDETNSDVENAQSELEKEVEDLNNLSGQLDTQASNLEQQFTTDFAIPDTVSGQGLNFQSIYTSLFGSLGVFGIFIWLPIVMAVIKKLLRL